MVEQHLDDAGRLLLHHAHQHHVPVRLDRDEQHDDTDARCGDARRTIVVLRLDEPVVEHHRTEQLGQLLLINAETGRPVHDDRRLHGRAHDGRVDVVGLVLPQHGPVEQGEVDVAVSDRALGVGLVVELDDADVGVEGVARLDQRLHQRRGRLHEADVELATTVVAAEDRREHDQRNRADHEHDRGDDERARARPEAELARRHQLGRAHVHRSASLLTAPPPRGRSR